MPLYGIGIEFATFGLFHCDGIGICRFGGITPWNNNISALMYKHLETMPTPGAHLRSQLLCNCCFLNVFFA